MPDLRKILVRQPGSHSFERIARACELHDETPGARWGHEFVHRSGDAYFVIDADKKCRACRKDAHCKRVKLRLVDLRRASPGRPSGRPESLWYPKIYRDDLLKSIEDKTELAEPVVQTIMLVLVLRSESHFFPAMLEVSDDPQDLRERRAKVLRQAASILHLELPLTKEKVEPIFALALQSFESEFQKKVPTNRRHPAVAQLNKYINEARGRIQRLGQVNS